MKGEVLTVSILIVKVEFGHGPGSPAVTVVAFERQWHISLRKDLEGEAKTYKYDRPSRQEGWCTTTCKVE